MERAVLTFAKGMNTDIDRSIRDQAAYLHASNFTFTSTDGPTNGALENARGNVLQPIFDIPQGHQVVGYVNVVKKIVVFTVDGTDSYIYLYDPDGDPQWSELYNDIASTSKLNFSTDPQYRIVAVGRQETADIEKAYWVDGLNELRYIDLNRSYTGVESVAFNAIPDTSLTSTIKTSLINASGNYTAGVVYHSYQFYSKNGAPSTVSSISQRSDLSNYISKDGGNDKDDPVTCTVKIEIDNIEQNVLDLYDRIRVFAIYYSEPSSPEIRVVTERPLTSSSIVVLDTGDATDTITLDQYLTYSQTTYTPKAITSKDNVLLIGNIKETTFTSPAIDDYDARAYRYFGAGNTAEIVDANDTTQYIRVGDGSIQPVGRVQISNIPGIVEGDLIPEDFDCYNKYNMIYTDDLHTRTFIDGNDLRYQADHTTIGGEGINVKYDFYDMGKEIGTYLSSILNSDYPVKNDQGNTYKNLTESLYLDMRECLDGEVYRVGIKFYNSKGQGSYVKWVGDILWEEHYSGDYGGQGLGITRPQLYIDNNIGYKVSEFNTLGDDTNKDVSSRVKVLRVSLNNNANLQALKDAGVVAWQLVRAERNPNDRTVIGNGILEHAEDPDSNGTYRAEFPSLAGYPIGNNSSLRIFKLIVPELMFNDPSSADISNYKIRAYNHFGDRINYAHRFGTTANESWFTTALNLVGLADHVNNFQNLFTIDHHIWVKPEYKNDGISDTPISIGDKQYLNQFMSTTINGDNYSAGASGFLVYLNKDISFLDGVDNTVSPLANTGAFYISVLANTDFTRYGGCTYQDIQNTTYIPFSPITDINGLQNYGTMGDSVTHMYYYLTEAFYASGSIESSQRIYAFPLQSSMDTRRRLDRMLDYYSGVATLSVYTTPPDIGWLAETVEKGIELHALEYDTTMGDLYRYNPVYSTDPNFKVSFPKPFDFTETIHSTTKVIASDKKINGENIDSWLNFKVNNFIEVDASRGGLNDLRTFNTRVFFWQDKGFGTIAVNERSLISDSSGAQLSLGTGTVLERYDYISTQIGNVDKYSISESENGIFWVYSPNNKIYSFGPDLKEISTSLGIRSFLETKGDILNPITTQDFISNETLFKINDEVLVYDWMTKTFTGVYTYVPQWFIPKFDGNFYTVYTDEFNNIDFYLHNSTGERCSYYGTLNDCSIKHLCNDKYPLTKTFDALSWDSVSKGIGGTIDGVNIYNNSFSQYRIYNDYQNTGWKSLVFKKYDQLLSGEVPVTRRERTFSTVISRNAVNVSQEDLYSGSIDILDPINLDDTQTFKERLRDKYAIIELKFDNGNPRFTNFTVPYIMVYYRPSIR